MKLNWDNWLLGVGSAFIGGGASAVVSGLTSSLAFHVDVTTWAGMVKMLTLMLINFVLTGSVSMFFYLKQSPLPTVVTETKTVTSSVKTETVTDKATEIKP